MTPDGWLILADDLTGAADTAAAFRRAGYSTVLHLALDGVVDEAGGRVVACDLDLREVDEGSEAIQERIRKTLGESSGHRRYYLKIDSTLRGPVRSLVHETLAALNDRFSLDNSLKALICPAFPAQGRITRDGIQYAHGEPVGFQGIPGGPTFSLYELFGTDGIRIHDAETDDDLRSLVKAYSNQPILWVGSAGLASALASNAPDHDPVPSMPEVERIVIVSGTANPRTHTQLDRIAQRFPLQPHGSMTAIGDRITLVQASRAGAEKLTDMVAHQVAENALSFIPPDLPTGWILTGGATSRHFLLAAGASFLEVGGEVSPGIPWSVARDGRLAGQPIVTKAGGFGEPDALLRAIRFLLHDLSVEG